MRLRTVAALALALVAACAAPPPDPATILARAADDLAAAPTLRFDLTREGAPVPLDPLTGATFTQATGEYRAPDRVHARVKAIAGSFILSLDALWLPDGVFVTDPLSGTYRRLAGAAAFDAAALFRKDGAPQVLRGLQRPTLVGTESVNGADAYHVRGGADGILLRPLSGGVLVEGGHTVDVWIDKARSRVLMVRDLEPGGGAWKLELSAFGEPVEIARP